MLPIASLGDTAISLTSIAWRDGIPLDKLCVQLMAPLSHRPSVQPWLVGFLALCTGQGPVRQIPPKCNIQPWGMLPNIPQLPQPPEFHCARPSQLQDGGQRLAQNAPVAGVRWRECQMGSQRIWWWRATRVVVAAAFKWRLLNTKGLSFENSVLWAGDGQRLVAARLRTSSDERCGEHRLGDRE